MDERRRKHIGNFLSEETAMGSFKKGKSLKNNYLAAEKLSAWDMKEHFDLYLAKKLEENDMVSYWIINELYRYYLSALDKPRPAKIV